MKGFLKRLSFVVLTATVLGATAWFDRLSPIPSALLLVTTTVLLACSASGGFNWATVSFAAIGAFLGAALRGTSFVVAGAVVLAAVFAERTLRVRGGVGRTVHLGASLLAGSAAMFLAQAFGARDMSLFGVAIAVGTALCALPLLIDADDAVAAELDRISKVVPANVAQELRNAAQMRRRAKDVAMDADVAKNVDGTFETLLRLAEARVRVQAASESDGESAQKVAALVDGKISLCASAIRKALAASDAVRAYATARDDQELHALSAKSESIEEVSRTLLEAEADVAALSMPVVGRASQTPAPAPPPQALSPVGIPVAAATPENVDQDLAHTA